MIGASYWPGAGIGTVSEPSLIDLYTNHRACRRGVIFALLEQPRSSRPRRLQRPPRYRIEAKEPYLTPLAAAPFRKVEYGHHTARPGVFDF